VQWFGQSAFCLSAGEHSVVIDPFGPGEQLAARGLQFSYPPIENVEADLLLITHEHFDHNYVDAVTGSPHVLRSTAGKLDSPLGSVLAVASEHDNQAGTARGPNTIFVFNLDGFKICHFGDFGQDELRLAQTHAIGVIDMLFLPVGGGPTIDAADAAKIVSKLNPRLIVPMHYRTPAIDFLETVDPFLESFQPSQIKRLESSVFDTQEFDAPKGQPLVVVPSTPT
jgi:L-ascorbate metabolism protein UlaG (beta-lactamase superfamily)